MASKFMEPAKALIKKHEGLRLKPYMDSEGIPTIGYGRNLAVGITKEEAELLFENDFRKAFNHASRFTWFHALSPERKQVIVNMIFNLGPHGFGTFQKMIAALEEHDYDRAADEMVDSKYATQVGKRAQELAVMMRG
jgi:lysozyme